MPWRPVAVGDELAQRAKPRWWRIAAALLAQHVLARLPMALTGNRWLAGRRREGDDLRIGGDFRISTDKGRLGTFSSAGQKRLHRVHLLTRWRSLHSNRQVIRLYQIFRNEAMAVHKNP